MATEEGIDTIHISGKAIAAIIILALLLISTFGMFILNSSDNSISVTPQSNSAYGEIPEKCKLPAGQDVNAWKEHLGHHSETQECLKYFN